QPLLGQRQREDPAGLFGLLLEQPCQRGALLLRREVGQPRVVDLSVHGYFLPLESRLWSSLSTSASEALASWAWTLPPGRRAMGWSAAPSARAGGAATRGVRP